MDPHTQQYIVASLELHLFFARIMKEHSLFLEAGFTPVNASFAKEADILKTKFEGVLHEAVKLGNGVIRPKVLHSGEIVTEFTAKVERQTQQFTGIQINSQITAQEMGMVAGKDFRATPCLMRQVRQLNQTALRLLGSLIGLKERILHSVTTCRMFTMNYPLLIEHILREARLYQSALVDLERGGLCVDLRLQKTEQFWNRIMMEHAQFIRGLLDPSEAALIETSNDFAEDYARLLDKARAGSMAAGRSQVNPSLQETLKFRDFKIAGTQGISECKIRSIILPLLADHVLREANHYIRLLKDE